VGTRIACIWTATATTHHTPAPGGDHDHLDPLPSAGYRTFKGFYTQHVHAHLRAEFPQLVSYTRFVALMPRYLVPLAVYLHTQRGACTGISFIDSTSLTVCHPARIHQHRVFRADARRGKTSVGWFYGFKLHLVVNDRGELLAVCLTPGNVDDRRPLLRLVRRLFGKLFGDKGYISAPLAQRLLLDQDLRLITKLRTNMRNVLMALSDKLLLRKRALIESINDQLKNVSQIERRPRRAGLVFVCPCPWACWAGCAVQPGSSSGRTLVDGLLFCASLRIALRAGLRVRRTGHDGILLVGTAAKWCGAAVG
jgi:Transposase DDE domain